MAADPYGWALVSAQVASMAVGLWPARRRWKLSRPVTAAGAALALGGATFSLAGVTRLGRRFRPDAMPARDAELRSDGVYGVVRHPIYTGLLVSGAGIAVLRARPEPLVALCALGLVLRIKVGHEERLLRERFGTTYDAYTQQVPRLVPWPRRPDPS